MNITSALIFEWAITLTFFLLSLALLFIFIRLVRGPALPDRVVALDLSAIVVIGILLVYSISHRQPVYIDIAIALALVAFLGTVAFARYIFYIGPEIEDGK